MSPQITSFGVSLPQEYNNVSIDLMNSSFSFIVLSFGGGREIRTPGGVTHNSFQDCRIKPLCHSSVLKI